MNIPKKESGLLLLLVLLLGCTVKNPENQAKSIVVAMANPRSPIDPHHSPLATIQGIYSHMVETLYTLDDQMQVIPLLARDLPLISDDGLLYTFTLRDDVYFHDGSHLTASDVEFLFERTFSPNTPAVSKAFYEEIAGVEEYFSGQSDTIKGITIIDDYTLTIELSHPSLAFLLALTMGYAGIIPKESFLAYQEEWARSMLIGSGPYKWQRYHPNEGLIMQVNPDYRDGESAIQSIEFRYFDNMNTALLEYERGNIDLVELSSDQYQQYAQSPYLDQIKSWPILATNLFFLNTSHPDLGKPLVREALRYAIDRDRIVHHVYHDLLTKVDNFVPKGSVGYNDQISIPATNIERAKELLAQAGYTDFIDLEVIYQTSQISDRQLWTLLQSQLKEAGFNLILNEVDPALFIELVMSGQATLYSRTWTLPYPDGSVFLDYMHSTSNHRASVNYNDPYLDSLIDQARSTANAQERKELYEQVERILVQDAILVIPYANKQIMSLINPHLVNVRNINSLYQFQGSDLLS